MKTLLLSLRPAVNSLVNAPVRFSPRRIAVSGSDSDSFFEWVDRFPAQVVLLSTQVRWSRQVEEALKSLRLEKAGKLITAGGDGDEERGSLPAVLADVKQTLNRTSRHAGIKLHDMYKHDAYASTYGTQLYTHDAYAIAS